jgi:hypothetical protein
MIWIDIMIYHVFPYGFIQITPSQTLLKPRQGNMLYAMFSFWQYPWWDDLSSSTILKMVKPSHLCIVDLSPIDSLLSSKKQPPHLQVEEMHFAVHVATGHLRRGWLRCGEAWMASLLGLASFHSNFSTKLWLQCSENFHFHSNFSAYFYWT